MNVLDFFNDENHQPSMSRLLCFMAFFPASYVVIITHNDATLSWYLSAYAAAYVGGKISNALRPKDKDGE